MGGSRFDAPFPEAAPEAAFLGGKRGSSSSTRVHACARRLPFRLYVDNSTLVEPVDVRLLRKGDHCMVGLNPVRKVSPVIDAMFTWMASWEVYPLHHHFICLDDVEYVDKDGVPRRGDGHPAMICEFSNTPAAAIRQLRWLGFSHVWRNLAPFHRLALHDYSDARQPNGVLRVVRRCDAEQRDEIVHRVETLLCRKNSVTYSVFFRNCEHAAFATTISRSESDEALDLRSLPSPSPRGRHWESPQVPHVLWTLLRFLIQVAGAFSLYRISSYCRSLSFFWPWFAEAPDVQRQMAVYHVFATLPTVLQVCVQFQRAMASLRRTRSKGKIDALMYRHLLGKETARLVIVGCMTTATIVGLPRLIHDTQLPLWAACALLVCAYMCSSLSFSVLASAGIRILLRLRGEHFFSSTATTTASATETRVRDDGGGGWHKATTVKTTYVEGTVEAVRSPWGWVGRESLAVRMLRGLQERPGWRVADVAGPGPRTVY